MNRQEKQDFLAQLSEMYGANQFVFLIKMNAVNAANALSFRSEIRGSKAECVVAKNTLSRIAAKQVGLDALDKYFVIRC